MKTATHPARRTTRRAGLLGLLAGALALSGVNAWAQTYPDRPVRLVVPFPAGGGADGAARTFADKLAGVLGQPVVIDNKPGASGNIGAEAVARAPADGYTLLFGNEFLSTNPNLYKQLRYDTLKDFAPVAKVATSAVAIAVHPSIPAQNMQELIALSKTRTLNYASPGVGTGPHLFGELMALQTGTKFNHIPYKGASPAMTDAVGGQVDVIISTLAPMVQFISGGKLRGLAVTGSTRSVQLPEMPTLAEAGVPGFRYEIWYAAFAPAGVPKAVLTRLQQASAQALTDPDLNARLRKAGYEPDTGTTPEALTALIKSDLDRWGRVVQDARIPRE
jgi:tripartite-type tricarboxylate transporter receptor subunit TctC